MALGLFPLPDHETLVGAFSGLASELRRHGYGEAATLPFPGGPMHIVTEPGVFLRYRSGQLNAYEHSPFAPIYYRHFARRQPGAYPLFRMFSLGEPLPAAELGALLEDALVRRLHDLGIFVADGGTIRSRVLATPIEDRILFHDVPSIDEEEKPDFVFLGRCSTRLARAAARGLSGRRVERALDLCTGSGVQALNVAPHADKVLGSDVNERALAYAAANARANGIVNASFRVSDVFQEISGTFDVITANTPFLLLHEGSKARDGYGGKYGMEIELKIFAELPARLRPGGRSWIVASSAFVGDRNLLVEKLTELYRGTPLAVDLHPISEYYSLGHYDVYESLGVTRCRLYIVETRHETTFSLVEHNWPLPLAALSRAKVNLDRWRARRAFARRASPIS